MLPIINIGPLAIQVPGLIIIAGIWLGLIFAEKYSIEFGVDSNKLYNLVFYTLIAGIIGARITYVLQFSNVFLENPLSIFSLNPSLLDPVGGIVIGSITAIIFIQKNRMSIWNTLDALTPLLLITIITFPLARLAAGSGYGTPTNLPWGIKLWGTIRHPVQIYEMIAGSAILAILFPSKKHVSSLSQGLYFVIFIALTSASRLFLEAFRGDRNTIYNGIRIVQVIYWVILAISLFWIGYTIKKENSKATKNLYIRQNNE
jgi:prolipoprotein diacylglyceryl transferase